MRAKLSLIATVIILASLFQIEILAQTATKSEVNAVAENLVTKSFFNQKGLKGSKVTSIEKLDSIIYDGITIGYFYYYQPYGFALIPKFKEINPYFAFSNDGKLNLDSDNFIPSFLKEELILRYRALKENKLQKETILNNIHAWEGYLVKDLEADYPIQIPVVGTTSTGGLIETTWGQSGIYNAYCPIDPVTNEQCPTGCVATAMAQIINYWGNLTGTSLSVNFSSADSYTYNLPGNGGGIVRVDINAPTASLSNISYPLSDENIGRLNFACGVSINMTYTSSSSYGGVGNAVGAFKKFLGFPDAKLLAYDGNFTNVLHENIENGLPCLLSISNDKSGHAIVCDGFIDDGTTVRFHLNYGWNGSYAKPTLFYEIPQNLPANYTTINYGAVNLKQGDGIFDKDANYYKTVKIGTQIWMAENLKTMRYNDNTIIPLVTDNVEWKTLITPGYCWYNNDLSTNKATYGALYNWYAVDAASNGGKNLCPTGWHVPTNTEWTILITFLGGSTIAGDKLKEAGITHWQSPNGGTNESGFKALPGGIHSSGGTFDLIGSRGYWWSASEYNSTLAYGRSMLYNYSSVSNIANSKQSGHSVRCVRDEIHNLTVEPSQGIIIACTSGASGNFSVSSNTSWTVTDNATWLNLSSSSGTENSTLIVTTTSANTSTSPRIANVTFSASGVNSVIVTVTQSGTGPILSVAPSSITIASTSGATGNFNVTSNANWSVIDDATWLNLSSASGTGNGTLTVTTTSANTSTSPRTANVTFSASGVSSVIVTVAQNVENLTLPILSTNAVSKITKTTAISGGNIISDGQSVITVKGVCWSTNPNPTVTLATKTNNGVGSGSFTSNISGLSSSKRYYLRAYATNSIGTAYGEETSFKTYNSDAIIDVDENYYNIIEIGSQVWLEENLRTTKFNDGNLIPTETDNAAWTSLATPAYCWYNNDVLNKDIYGALYNWYSINTGKLCPSSWHIPSDDEWTILIDFLEGESVAGGKLKEIGTNHWVSPNTGATNESGFNAVPAGSRYIGVGLFANLGQRADWWSSNLPYSYSIWNYQESVFRGSFSIPEYGFSVRCIQNVTLTTAKSNSAIKIFPNPVVGLLTIDYNDDNGNFKSIYILDSQGKLLVKEKAVFPIQQIDFSKFSSGYYILEFIKSSGKSLKVKILKY